MTLLNFALAGLFIFLGAHNMCVGSPFYMLNALFASWIIYAAINK